MHQTHQTAFVHACAFRAIRGGIYAPKAPRVFIPGALVHASVHRVEPFQSGFTP